MDRPDLNHFCVLCQRLCNEDQDGHRSCFHGFWLTNLYNLNVLMAFNSVFIFERSMLLHTLS